jgi:hypothetical protein
MWIAKSTGSSITNPWIASSDPTTEEKITLLIDRDRVKTAARKGKEKEGSSSQSEYSSTVDDIMLL